MQIIVSVTPERVACCQESTSKERTLSKSVSCWPRACRDHGSTEVFDSSFGRERLGSTASGSWRRIPTAVSMVCKGVSREALRPGTLEREIFA